MRATGGVVQRRGGGVADPGRLIDARASARNASRVVKRAMDIAIAVPLLVLAAPLIFLSALAVLITDGRPVFFVQLRVGLSGRTFRLLKVRTMRRDAAVQLDHILETDPVRAAEFARYLCLQDDPRVLPRVGRFLRQSSIDELPQLFNVVVGSMSMVGPRPLPPTLLEVLPAGYVATRQLVKPGLTGLWQINGRSANDVEEWIRIDDQYARSWSLRRDLGIVIRTPFALISRRGVN